MENRSEYGKIVAEFSPESNLSPGLAFFRQLYKLQHLLWKKIDKKKRHQLYLSRFYIKGFYKNKEIFSIVLRSLKDFELVISMLLETATSLNIPVRTPSRKSKNLVDYMSRLIKIYNEIYSNQENNDEFLEISVSFKKIILQIPCQAKDHYHIRKHGFRTRENYFIISLENLQDFIPLITKMQGLFRDLK